MAGRQERPPTSRRGTRDDVVPLTRMHSELRGGQARVLPSDDHLPSGDVQQPQDSKARPVYPDKPLPVMPEQSPILEVKDVGCYKAPGQPIFAHVNLTLNEGDVLILRGKSGSG